MALNVAMDGVSFPHRHEPANGLMAEGNQMADKVDVRKTLIVAQQVAEQQRVDAMEAGNDRLAASKQAQVESLRAATLAFAELIEAAIRANGDHHAPDDCYATGPLTGDPFRDLVECPGCVLAATLASLAGAAP